MKVKVLFVKSDTYTDEDLESYVDDYKCMYSSTYTSFENIVRIIGNVFKAYYLIIALIVRKMIYIYPCVRIGKTDYMFLSLIV